MPQRSRTLSFSTTQQAFLPARPRLSQSTSSVLPFPSLEEGKVPSSVKLDRTPTSGSSASAAPPLRRLRPTKTVVSARGPTSLRVPGPGGRAGRAADPATEYLEAKVVILGSQGVGKTSLINRSTTGHFSHGRSSTIGASFLTKKLTVEDTRVHFQLWDAAGQERFRALMPLYYRGAQAAVLVYDVTDESSLQDIKFWIEELRKNMSDELIILVVGTKADLASSCPTIPLADAQRNIALWLHELDNPPSDDDPPAPPPPAPPPLHPRNALPGSAAASKASLTRSRTYSTPLFAASIPTITTTEPPAPTATPSTRPSPRSHHSHSQSASVSSGVAPRSRGMSTMLGYSTPSPLQPTLPSTSHPPPPQSAPASRPTSGLVSSATMPDLSAYTLAGLNLAGLSSASAGSAALESLNMVRSSSAGATSSSSGSSPTAAGTSPSGSSTSAAPSLPHSASFNLLSLSHSLSLAGAQVAAFTHRGVSNVTSSSDARARARRQSADERLRREWEAYAATLRARDEAEQARVRAIVEACAVEVVEVSAKDGWGIEEVFWRIAGGLIERREEIERRRTLRSRDSIVLREDDHVDVKKKGWCGC
ncbi:hypothetical protein Rhopal_003872-T1 [Rhodotorula paludigena]|uniref:Ras-domain-containing protein n=1 Tax=Rhodotorula paludigena TaxID=86838 RepID=A0AAV5GKV9_9BASI|nr:hypothetical protein Rhopal_003872-T1 [Rhodotorula paludigena]